MLENRLKEYRNASNKRPGAYLIFEDPGWALICQLGNHPSVR